MTEAILRVRGLIKRYGKLRAVDALDIDIAAGEFVALLGPNGAGRTTLFQMLTGLFTPDAGTATIAGHDIRRDTTAALAAIGVVFQQPTIDLEMSVARNLRFHAKLHGLARPVREARILDALTTMNLSEQSRQRVRTLSGGNRRRVELARALLHEPRLLLMDEASVGLDPASRRDLLGRVEGLRRERGLAVFAAGFQNVFGVAIIPPYQTYISYQLYVLPGLVGMILLFQGMQSSLSMVYDREMGMMRLLLTAPLPRWYLLLALIAGGLMLGALGLLLFFVLAIWGYDPQRGLVRHVRRPA
jgi:ABC-2 type transport system ATP-binding protein